MEMVCVSKGNQSVVMRLSISEIGINAERKVTGMSKSGCRWPLRNIEETRTSMSIIPSGCTSTARHHWEVQRAQARLWPEFEE
jgi:hypothetical protein